MHAFLPVIFISVLNSRPIVHIQQYVLFVHIIHAPFIPPFPLSLAILLVRYEIGISLGQRKHRATRNVQEINVQVARTSKKQTKAGGLVVSETPRVVYMRDMDQEPGFAGAGLLYIYTKYTSRLFVVLRPSVLVASRNLIVYILSIYIYVRSHSCNFFQFYKCVYLMYTWHSILIAHIVPSGLLVATYQVYFVYDFKKCLQLLSSSC